MADLMSYFMLVVGCTIGIGYMLRNLLVRGKRCKSKAKLHGKTVIVTGSNTGIGKTTAICLARRGARVILACRNKLRGEVAVAEVKEESRSSEVVFMQLDLGSLRSVRSFAENFLTAEPRLDLLINNAGLLRHGRTEDGLGMMFGVNHIGHFLLTNLLLERLNACGPSRVVTVASVGHNLGKIDFNCLNTHKALGTGTSPLNAVQMYNASKLCNVLFTHELAKRLQGTKVTCYSLHPGAINSDIGRNWSKVFKAVKPFTAFFFKNTEEGAQTTLHCALQEGIEGLSGKYFSNCTVKDVYPKAKDDVAAKKTVGAHVQCAFVLPCVGSNTGIGKATALDLARRGARVVLACRNKEKAEAAAYDIRRESGNNEVVFMQLDLGSLKSVRAFAETFLKTEPRLDLLINNAGVMGSGHTEDGFGVAFGVNHLGHFLLTTLLLERLQQCAPSRVVTVSALLHRLGAVDCPLLRSEKDLVWSQSAWLYAIRSYCNSKLCNVLFTRELANRLEGTGVTCYSLHPGVVYTEICRNMHAWQRIFLMPVAKLFFLDSEAGSQTTLYCALQMGIEPLSGRYFSSCRPQQVGAKGRDDGLASKLWELSERLTSSVTS
ncbi:Dehydrogenase/reductase SDR family member 13 [Merluccius polli]|uniref:Dehydrogenase/reductase SDR family member 13 n=1 Tax=Merluccius polli TaxID=89951 RepID=A0AA47M7K5_MERPO|nr:Dehydrogenase/reductase SDR family member 13 [Merluccius polli]